MLSRLGNRAASSAHDESISTSLPSAPQPSTNEITFAVVPSRHAAPSPPAADATVAEPEDDDCRCCCSARTARRPSPRSCMLRRGREGARMEAGSDAPGERR